MTLRVERLRLSDGEAMQQWDTYVSMHPQRTPFHYSCWLHVIQDSYKFEDLLHVLRDDTKQIRAVFPSFWVDTFLTSARIISLPFSDYGGALADNEDEALAIVESVLSMNKKSARFIESRGGVVRQAARLDAYTRHRIDLTPDVEEIWRRADKKTVQYWVRRAQRAGMTIVEGCDERAIQQFQRLNNLTRKKHGVPVQPKIWFDNLGKFILAPGRGYLSLAIYHGSCVGAGLFLTDNGATYYKYNASDPDSIRVLSPNHLLTWHAIRKAKAAGSLYFDFGRTHVSNAGLMHYKEMWGARPEDLPYFFYPESVRMHHDPESGATLRAARWAWRHLPDVVANWAGPLIYRHFG